MGNVSEISKIERRAKVKECWANGERNVYKIAEQLKINVGTVQRDLVVLRKSSLRKYKNDDMMTLVKLEEDAGLLQIICNLSALINKAMTEPEKKTEIIAENDQPVKKSQETTGINYTAIGTLFEKLLRARRQRAEVWGLITRGPSISVSATAQAAAASYNSPVKNLKDAELDSIADKLIQRGKGISG